MSRSVVLELLHDKVLIESLTLRWIKYGGAKGARPSLNSREKFGLLFREQCSITGGEPFLAVSGHTLWKFLDQLLTTIKKNLLCLSFFVCFLNLCWGLWMFISPCDTVLLFNFYGVKMTACRVVKRYCLSVTGL